MTITLKYFGLIADITNTNEELFNLEKSDYTSQDLINQLYEKYTGLQQVSFAIAVNKSIISAEINLNDNDLIALLPPFAGG
jgi:molybdopterin synthase sulfur carrier subunit